ncbi:MAG: glycosyltransferase family 2 protein [Chloroflexi bacterium CFX4]|nr:glycosyltransferase family 2 protein [Chloroflexi bacterium CFX4]MDL1922819.1 glycosyltransferase family 2 protein [Chloroflexi bacterium CFX3]
MPPDLMLSEHALELSVVLPCLNEAETLAACLAAAWAGLAALGISGEVVVADNGSLDGSPSLAEQHGARLVYVAQRGYGRALQAGIHAARGRYVIIADSDGSYDLSYLKPFWAKLHAGYALVIGTRFKGKILPRAMPPLHRYLGNPLLTWLANRLFGTCLSDYHCGMRAFERAALLNLPLHAGGMEFATEMIAQAALNNLPLAEVPITYAPDGRSRPPHLRPWRDGWRHLRLMLHLKWQRRKMRLAQAVSVKPPSTTST